MLIHSAAPRLRSILILLCAALGAPAAAAPQVSVFESEAASRWLAAASVIHLPVSAEELESSGLPGEGLLIVPLDRVRTPRIAQRIAEFAARGGKILAVYWGPLVRPEARGAHPVYTLGPILGVRPHGWRGADPILVRPGDRGGETDEIADLRLARGSVVRVDPLPGATILARWAPAGRRTATPPEKGTLAVTFGNHLYLAVDLFAPRNDTPSGQQFFLWAINQLAPGLVYSRARERAGLAMAAVIRAETALAEAEKAQPDGDVRAAREKLAEAREYANRAKQAAATDRFLDATANSVRAMALAEEAMRLIAPPAPPLPVDPGLGP